MSRTPKNYDGILPTTKCLKDLLPKALGSISRVFKDQGSLIINAWPEVIGEKLAPMTKAVAFEDGILFVQVANSTLYSLLATHEKKKLLLLLQKKFPSVNIRNITFRIG